MDSDIAGTSRRSGGSLSVSDVHSAHSVDGHIPGCEPFAETVYDCSSAAIVRDLHYMSKEARKPARIARLVNSGLVLGLCVFLQAFLIFKVKEFVTAKAVHDIRHAYDIFETEMYSASDIVTTVNGFHRGQHASAFHPENFKNVPSDVQSTVCRIPLTQPEFFFFVLFIWSLTVMGEFHFCYKWWKCLIFRTTTVGGWADGMVICFDDPESEEFIPDDEDDNREKTVFSLPCSVKAVLILLVGIPRTLVAGYLLWLGSRWLAATANFADLIMNAVALEFILTLKELLYSVLEHERTKVDRGRTMLLPTQARLGMTVFQSFSGTLLALVAGFWTYFYMYHLQSVLPMYQFDVRPICELWIAERYALTAR